MAGRTAVLTLLPLSYKELLQSGLAPTTNRFIINGGYPAIWLDESVRTEIYSNYYTTYIERDVRVSVDCTDEKITGSCVKNIFGK